MPKYFFNLKTAKGNICDPDGTELADLASARKHACVVARELMRQRETQTRSWRIDVRDSEERPCFELLFASVDDSIANFDPKLRGLVENFHRKQGSLFDAIQDLQLSLHQIKATIARSEGAPCLASLDGVRIAAPAGQ